MVGHQDLKRISASRISWFYLFFQASNSLEITLLRRGTVAFVGSFWCSYQDGPRDNDELEFGFGGG